MSNRIIATTEVASTVEVVQALARPEWLVEIEGIAFLPASA